MLTNTRGQRWTKWTVQSVMRGLAVDWTFQDLRRYLRADQARDTRPLRRGVGKFETR
jgi:hypothetical protein